MSNDTTASATQAAVDGANLTPQAGDATTTPSQADASQKPLKSADDYERMLSELRKENASHRTKLNRFEEEAKKQAEAQLSKEQLLEKQLAELTAQREQETQAHLERTINQEVTVQAAKLGVDPAYLDKVARFLEWENVDVDDNGNPTNIRELVEQLVKDMPALRTKGTAPTSGGVTNPARSVSGASPEITPEYLAGLTQSDWLKFTPEQKRKIQQWQLKNPPQYR